MNTRTYNRNSTLAFPKTTDYACALERPYKVRMDWQDRLVVAACIVALVITIAVIA
jgi:hypothetical protein